MTCDLCDYITNSPIKGTYPYRIGNKEIGYGTILIIACPKHAKLTIDTLNHVIDELERENDKL